MKNSLLLLLAFLASTCLHISLAFHERVGRGNSLERKPKIQTSSDAAAAPQVLMALARHRRHQDATSTALFASRQFRNVEEMLDSFHEELVLINFMAVNCGPCKLQKKELAAVSRAFGRDLHMLAIDTNRWPSVSSRFDVGKLPCLVAMKNGDVLFRLEGLTKAEDVVAQVRSVQQHRQYSV